MKRTSFARVCLFFICLQSGLGEFQDEVRKGKEREMEAQVRDQQRKLQGSQERGTVGFGTTPGLVPGKIRNYLIWPSVSQSIRAANCSPKLSPVL